MSAPLLPVNAFCLGLTGGIGCGKTTVGKLLESRGLIRVDSDELAREVVKPGTSGWKSVVEHFGSSILQPDRSLDRPQLAKLVFSNPTLRHELEAILHPLIWQRIEEAQIEASLEGKETVFEVPLLFEKGRRDQFHTVWVVSVPRHIQIQRLQERDLLSTEDTEARLSSQMSLAEKEKLADFVIFNFKSLEDLDAQIDFGLDLWRQRRVMR